MPKPVTYNIPQSEYTRSISYNLNRRYVAGFREACRLLGVRINMFLEGFMEAIIDHFMDMEDGIEPNTSQVLLDMIEESKGDDVMKKLKEMDRDRICFRPSIEVTSRFADVCKKNGVRTTMLVNLFVKHVAEYEFDPLMIDLTKTEYDI